MSRADVDKRVCLLTGSGGTLGGEFCERYADRYAIAAVYRERPPGVASQFLEWADPLEPDGDLPENRHPVFEIRADLCVPGEIQRVVELTLARFGRIDILLNSAAHSVWGGMIETDALLESADRQFRMNVTVPLALAVEVARTHWRDRKRSNLERRCHVLNVSSSGGVEMVPGRGMSVYGASKAALNQLTLHMASEFSVFGVRANALAPSSFPQRLSTESVAEALVRLDDGHETGRILVMTGDKEWYI